MEVLLFALFFISALFFFISGKDDFGRTENMTPVILEADECKIGEIIDVEVNSFNKKVFSKPK